MINDMIAENVRKLLLSLMKDEVIVASWGGGIKHQYLRDKNIFFS